MAERAAKLEEMRKAAEKQAAKIKENKWVLPLASYGITATFGQYGLWASYHTGLDFNGNSGDPIMAVANGTVTSTGYDGAYGNKTVVTLDDGTEIWFCHQTAIYVSVGEPRQRRRGHRHRRRHRQRHRLPPPPRGPPRRRRPGRPVPGLRRARHRSLTSAERYRL